MPKTSFKAQWGEFMFFLRYLLGSVFMQLKKYYQDDNIDSVGTARMLKHICMFSASVTFYILVDFSATVVLLFFVIMFQCFEIHRKGYWKHQMRNKHKVFNDRKTN